MRHVNMAAHELRTEDCERLVRLNENQHCFENKTSIDYKDKTKAFSDNCSGTQSDILFFVNFIFSCKQHYAFKVG